MNGTSQKRIYFLLRWGGLAILLGMFVGLAIVVWLVWGQNVETDDWTAVAAIGTLVGGMGVILGVPFAAYGIYLVSKAQGQRAKAAESQHLMDVLRKWDEETLEKARRKVREYQSGEDLLRILSELAEQGYPEDYFTLLRVANFFEDLGVLVFDMGVIRLDSIRNSLGSSIADYWGLYEPHTLSLRNAGHTTVYQWFEKLKIGMATAS